MNEDELDIGYMDSQIEVFLEQYSGTSYGESVRNRRENTRDDDWGGIHEIFSELEQDGFV